LRMALENFLGPPLEKSSVAWAWQKPNLQKRISCLPHSV
jgi:hypothetical protein